MSELIVEALQQRELQKTDQQYEIQIQLPITGPHRVCRRVADDLVGSGTNIERRHSGTTPYCRWRMGVYGVTPSGNAGPASCIGNKPPTPISPALRGLCVNGHRQR